jgi:hypothetical protein
MEEYWDFPVWCGKCRFRIRPCVRCRGWTGSSEHSVVVSEGREATGERKEVEEEEELVADPVADEAAETAN